ncbi:MAG: type II CAAX endopeptidase family protein [Ferruginibacter sp.]
MPNELRPFWGRFFNLNWKFGLFLVLLICVPRFILVLQANASGNYKYIGIIMVISAAAPFIFLSKYGRKKIGITRPQKIYWILLAFVTGLAASYLLHLAGKGLYGDSYENWYKYIGKSYNIPAGIDAKSKAILFTVMAFTGMIFSPVGEELFFRGIVHAGFAVSLGEKKAFIIDSAAFAITHIAHFGLVFINNQWSFFTLPAFIWVAGMFLVSLLFFVFKQYTGSIIGSIICHAAFNLGMIYCIFYLL